MTGRIKLTVVCVVVAMMAVSCNTGQRIGWAERKQQNNIRLPFRTEQKQNQVKPELPQHVTYKDEGGQLQTVMVAEYDSLTGKHEIIGGQLSEVVVTALAKSVPERGGKVNIDFIVSVPERLMKRDWRMVICPVLDNAGKLRQLDSLEITGYENYSYNVRRQRQLDREMRGFKRAKARMHERMAWADPSLHGSSAADVFGTQPQTRRIINGAASLDEEGMRLDTVMTHGDDYVYYYTQQIDTRDMATHLRVWFDSYIVNCGDDVFPLLASDTVDFYISSFLQFMDKTPRYIRQTIQRRVTDKMSANIQFPVGQAVLVDTLAGNRSELDSVRARLERIYADNIFVVDSVSISAYASPEGSLSSNRSLAARRGQTLVGILKDMDIHNVLPDDDGIRVRTDAENWSGLRSQVLASPYITNAEAIARTIDTERDLDRREALIRSSWPADYDYMRNHIYPSLRAVDFVFHLARRGMVEDVMFTDEIDTEYAQAIELMNQRRYKEAMPKLLEYTDFNTAICYMSLGYNGTALKILESLEPTADNIYLQAIIHAREGRTDKAIQLYLQSCAMDSSKVMRGELDPEMADLIKAYDLHASFVDE